ncbi:MAG: bifunctional (p)ppGpp synthetase/guanosine-3',5'-bis(diphosphate) 3'-pyrophosphohydrolase, partial [Thiobacillus sp.]|nr:bifunctional (p)ppGpp synthetase/guanosine-3',5'-bis(diphosphate) 3'-pyrophosphohydrolase [Thiobacillus sp.]
TVHRADCPIIVTLADDKKDRLLRAEWGASAGQTFEVDVEILASDRANLLKDVAEALTQDKLNVVKVNTESRDGEARMAFTVIVRDAGQLSRFLARATHIRGVTQVRRK